MPELPVILRELFDSGNSERLVSATKDALEMLPGDPDILAYRAFAETAEVIRVYKRDAEELLRQSYDKGTRTFFSKLLLGKDTFFTDSMHERYFADVEKAVDGLVLALERLAEGNELRRCLSAAACKLLLEGAPKEMDSMRFLLSADDTFAQRLLTYMSKEDILAAKSDYLAAYPKKRDRLPNQEKLLREMNARTTG